MTVAEFMKKPLKVQAVQWTGKNAAELEQFTRDEAGSPDFMTDPYLDGPEVWDSAQEDWVRVNFEDWIVKGVKGEHYPVADDIFKETYGPC